MNALVPLPQNIAVVAEVDAIVIRRTWRSAAAYVLAFFTLFWLGFVVVWMFQTLREGQLMIAAFGSLHACVGLGLAYFTLASFVNKTDIRIDPNTLTVKHMPVPWFGNKAIAVHEIAQIYCERREQRGKNGTRVTYKVHCIDRNGRKKTLLSGLQGRDQARYIEHEIEKILGISNRPVEGEM